MYKTVVYRTMHTYIQNTVRHILYHITSLLYIVLYYSVPLLYTHTSTYIIYTAPHYLPIGVINCCRNPGINSKEGQK